MILGYWNIRGRGQPLRFFLEYLDIPYTEKRYTNPNEWFGKDKIHHTFKTALPNLPYLIDEGNVITESDAIFHHLALKTKNLEMIAPSDPETHILLTQIRGVIMDLATDIITLAFSPDFDKIEKDFIASKITPRLEKLSIVLGKNDWLCGKNLTYIDFLFHETLECLNKHSAEIVKAPNLLVYMSRFKEIPKIKEYLKSPRWVEVPFLMPGKARLGTKI